MKRPYPFLSRDPQPRDLARHKAVTRWQSIIKRAGNADGKHPTYHWVEVRFTRDEFLAWAIPAYRRWFKAHPGILACIDRENNKGHYEIGNLRLVTLADSNRNRHHAGKPRKYPIGLRLCRECGKLLPEERFYSKPGPHCKQHENLNHSERRRKKNLSKRTTLKSQ